MTLVRKDLGAVAAFRLVAQVKALPRTRYVTMRMGMMMMVAMKMVTMMMKMAMTMRMGKGLGNVIVFGLANVKILPKTISDQHSVNRVICVSDPGRPHGRRSPTWRTGRL